MTEKTGAIGMKPVEVAIIAALVGVAAFFGGMKYSDMQRQSQRGAMVRQFQNGQGGAAMMGAGGTNGTNRGGRMGGRPVMGDVMSIDATSMTVKLTDGSSKIVVLPDSATVSQTSTATKAEIKVGSKVGVYGTENSDGSVTAQNVQLNPAFGGMMGGRIPGASGSSSTK